jgi:hypothetical protein
MIPVFFVKKRFVFLQTATRFPEEFHLNNFIAMLSDHHVAKFKNSFSKGTGVGYSNFFVNRSQRIPHYKFQ